MKALLSNEGLKLPEQSVRCYIRGKLQIWILLRKRALCSMMAVKAESREILVRNWIENIHVSRMIYYITQIENQIKFLYKNIPSVLTFTISLLTKLFIWKLTHPWTLHWGASGHVCNSRWFTLQKRDKVSSFCMPCVCMFFVCWAFLYKWITWQTMDQLLRECTIVTSRRRLIHSWNKLVFEETAWSCVKKVNLLNVWPSKSSLPS